MKNRILLTSAICLISGFVLMGKAEAGLAWFGFSQLCFQGDFKGGSVKEGLLTITLKNLVVRAGCLNTQSAADSCQPGEGNSGSLTFTVPASADPTKEKGIISAEGCVPLDVYDHHSDPEHQHICLPLDNTNKEEIPGSAHIPKIETDWVLTNNDKVIRRGFQTCFWKGTVDPLTCQPSHTNSIDSDFVCPTDEEFKR